MTSFVDDLAVIVSKKLGRKVFLHRYQEGGKSRNPSAMRYSIAVEGCSVAWRDLNINEAKGRLAMLADLLSHGVIIAGEGTSAEIIGNPTELRGEPERSEAFREAGESRYPGRGEYALSNHASFLRRGGSWFVGPGYGHRIGLFSAPGSLGPID